MKQLNFVFTCLDGNYEFVGKLDDVLVYTVETNIEGLNSFEGELDKKNSEEFLKKVEMANIDKWDREYKGDNPIEDGVKWYAKYIDEDKVYVSSGEESFEPYNYEHLIEALLVCDKNAEYFMIGR